MAFPIADRRPASPRPPPRQPDRQCWLKDSGSPLLFDIVKKYAPRGAGHDWMMLAHPAYGSYESAPYGHDFKLSDDEKRVKKLGVLLPSPAKP